MRALQSKLRVGIMSHDDHRDDSKPNAVLNECHVCNELITIYECNVHE